MNSIALCADSKTVIRRFSLKMLAASCATVLMTGCAGIGTSIGISVPIGGFGGVGGVGGVGVSIGSGGTVSGSVGVGSGGGSVSVGATGQLPKPAEKKPEAEIEKKEEKKP